jgi:crotonobetainyl-CoA:carnitine CoA-transferase CaiB-like acyl-CoA transferase
MSAGALHGLRVLDMSRVLAGPWAGQMLGDLGADVVKVERPGDGDDTRAWGPPWVRDPEGRESSDSAYFTCANRNKRSVAIDLSAPEGQRQIRALAAKADVLIENFKVGGLRDYGLDWDSLSQSNTRLIYCSITGFGQSGPYAQRPGYDFLIQGLGGLMSITGRPDGAAGGGPMKAGVALVDVMTGLNATVAILAALQHRHATGKGQHIDLALLDVQVAALANQAANFLVGDKMPGRMGNSHPNIVPYQDFATADGYMILTIGNDGQFANFASVAGHAEWAGDERFRTNALRVRNRDVLVPLIESVMAMRTTGHWLGLMEAAGVPCGPINNVSDVFSDPQVVARSMRIEMQTPLGGSLQGVGSPLRLSAASVSYRYGPPALGAHTSEVLHEWLGDEDAPA